MAFKRLIDSKKLLAFFAVFMLLGTNLLMAQDATTATTDKPGVNWLSIGFYVLLFLLIAVSIGIIGKVLKVYDLSQQIQGKKGIHWNNFMGFTFIIFLIAGMIGAYWEFTVQGTMTLPEAASKHGVRIDAMFLTTFIITLIVFVITQILLFTFLFQIQAFTKKKSLFFTA